MKVLIGIFLFLTILSCTDENSPDESQNTKEETRKTTFLPLSAERINQIIKEVIELNPGTLPENSKIFPFVVNIDALNLNLHAFSEIKLKKSDVSNFKLQNKAFKHTALLPWIFNEYELEFKKKYNIDSTRYTQFSVPLITKDMKHLLLEISQIGRTKDGSGIIYVFRKENDHLVQIMKSQSWVE